MLKFISDILRLIVRVRRDCMYMVACKALVGINYMGIFKLLIINVVALLIDRIYLIT